MIKALYYIEKISNSLAIQVVIEKHYLHRRPPCIHSFGLFEQSTRKLKGVVVYGQVVSDTLSRHLCGENNKNNIYELTRLWVDDSVPKNGESFLIGNTIKLLDREIIVSFADTSQNHLGTIYQATNFVYTGLSSKGRDLKIRGQDTNKSSLKLEDTVENLKLKYGENNVYYEIRSRKHRYVYFNCGSHRKAQLLTELKYKPVLYPKLSTKNIIYALKDPITKELRYIGKSTSGIKRPNQHKRKHSLLANNHKNNWIKSLLNQGLCYETVVLEENIHIDKLNDREKHWIAYYKSKNVNLTNQTDGGEGTQGYQIQDSSKKIMSNKRKEWYKAVGPSQKMKDVCFKRKEYKFIDNIECKHCWKCDTYKPLELFGFADNRWDKKNPQCKECHNNIMAKYREAHAGPLLTKEEMVKSYADRKEAMRAGVIQAYKNNPDIKKKISAKTSKPILQCELNTSKIIREFPSALAAKEAGFDNGNIGQAIKFKKPYRGYTWKFKNQD